MIYLTCQTTQTTTANSERMSKYPRVSGVSSRKPQGMCHVCQTVIVDGKKPDVNVTVEFNHMRGDDEVYKCHRACVQFKRNDRGFLEALGVI